MKSPLGEYIEKKVQAETMDHANTYRSGGTQGSNTGDWEGVVLEAESKPRPVGREVKN